MGVARLFAEALQAGEKILVRGLQELLRVAETEKGGRGRERKGEGREGEMGTNATGSSARSPARSLARSRRSSQSSCTFSPPPAHLRELVRDRPALPALVDAPHHRVKHRPADVWDVDHGAAPAAARGIGGHAVGAHWPRGRLRDTPERERGGGGDGRCHRATRGVKSDSRRTREEGRRRHAPRGSPRRTWP